MGGSRPELSPSDSWGLVCGVKESVFDALRVFRRKVTQSDCMQKIPLQIEAYNLLSTGGARHQEMSRMM